RSNLTIPLGRQTRSLTRRTERARSTVPRTLRSYPAREVPRLRVVLAGISIDGSIQDQGGTKVSLQWRATGGTSVRAHASKRSVYIQTLRINVRRSLVVRDRHVRVVNG